ncbi:PIN domain-containing protein [Candidatus Pacearchaeota archaeon]|nr:PIN domain-containing protein [Candidatus Pacearchaeota archaeon]
MSGSRELPKIAIDTNVIFMALYNPLGKAGKILDLANREKINLFSTDTVKVEIARVLKRELKWEDNLINKKISGFPIVWIEKDFYSDFLDKTIVKHKADKPLEALSLALNCEILSADEHFKPVKNRADIDKLLKGFG